MFIAVQELWQLLNQLKPNSFFIPSLKLRMYTSDNTFMPTL